LNLSDAELIARLTQTEDSFVERKSQADKTGWLKTAVAFANSTPIGLPAVLFIGVDNDGSIEGNVNAERAMQTFSDYVGSHAWPPIFTLPRSLIHDGRTCVAVIIPGSPERPHFAGRSCQARDADKGRFHAAICANGRVAEQQML